MSGEDLLRETFATYAERAPRAHGLAGAVRSRVTRRRRVWLAAGAATAATVAGVTVGALALAPARETNPSKPATQPPSEPGRQVTFHGLEITVPEDWPVNENRCGQPTRDAVMMGSIVVFTCMEPAHTDLTVATLQPVGIWDTFAKDAHVELVGKDAKSERFTGTAADGRRLDALVARDLGVAVWVVSPGATAGPRILASARFVSTSVEGCPARVSALYGTAAPQRPGATERMVPGSPTEASVCEYGTGTGWNVGGLRLDAAGAARLAVMANALEPGFEPPDSRICDGNELRADLRRANESAYVVTFRYASGPDVVLYAHSAPCHDDGITNGAVRGRWSVPLGTMLRLAAEEMRVYVPPS